jgi:predicted GH43/DUF377 family glycosyl hydrolase
MCHWGMHCLADAAAATRSANGGNAPKLGGPVPIEIEDGWLLIYHGVMTPATACYSMGA